MFPRLCCRYGYPTRLNACGKLDELCSTGGEFDLPQCCPIQVDKTPEQGYCSVLSSSSTRNEVVIVIKYSLIHYVTILCPGYQKSESISPTCFSYVIFVTLCFCSILRCNVFREQFAVHCRPQRWITWTLVGYSMIFNRYLKHLVCHYHLCLECVTYEESGCDAEHPCCEGLTCVEDGTYQYCSPLNDNEMFTCNESTQADDMILKGCRGDLKCFLNSTTSIYMCHECTVEGAECGDHHPGCCGTMLYLTDPDNSDTSTCQSCTELNHVYVTILIGYAVLI